MYDGIGCKCNDNIFLVILYSYTSLFVVNIDTSLGLFTLLRKFKIILNQV